MQITSKCVAAITVAIVLGFSSNALASETGDSSIDTLKQEIVKLRQVVVELSTYIMNIETRLRNLELAVSQGENNNQHTFSLDVEMGTWIDDLQMPQMRYQRLLDDDLIQPVKPLR